MPSNQNNKLPLNNNSTFRNISDSLDKACGWAGYEDPKQSKTRASVHAAYHETQHQLGRLTNSAPYKKANDVLTEYTKVSLPTVRDNPREHERAKDQWGIVTNGPKDNLQKYDEAQEKK